jgi:hypothetical protein
MPAKFFHTSLYSYYGYNREEMETFAVMVIVVLITTIITPTDDEAGVCINARCFKIHAVSRRIHDAEAAFFVSRINILIRLILKKY